MLADLHVHTTASDGALSPSEVVRLAKITGLGTIAITDHDTTAGLNEAIEAGNLLQMKVVPGIELSTQIGEKEVHILGYFLDYQNPCLEEKLLNLRMDRVNRNKKIIARLNKLGYTLEWEQVLELAGRGSVGRPHVALALKEKGYVSSLEEAFRKLLNRGAPAFVPRKKLTPKEAVNLIKSAQGVAVLAHPGLLNDHSLVKKIIYSGIQGMEVYYPLHSHDDMELFLDLCTKDKLIATGGSDFHGHDSESKAQIGGATVSFQAVQALEKLKGERHNGAG